MKIDIIGWFERAYSRFPSINAEIKETIVKILPVASLFFGILISVASILDFLGSAFISSLTLGGGGPSLIQQLVLRSTLGIAQGVIMVFAFNQLRRQTQTGWRLFFWSQILWIISTAISFSPSFILGLVLLYPLLEVKNYYK